MKKLLILITSLLFAATSVWAATITVGPTGFPTYDYATIKDAIVAGTTNPLDVIKVYPGTYNTGSYIIVNKNGLQIIGVDASGNPIASAAGVLATVGPLSGGEADMVFHVTADNVTISGIRIADLNNKAMTINGDNFTLTNCRFENEWDLSGAIYFYDATPGIKSNLSPSYQKTFTITGNVIKGWGVTITDGTGCGWPASGRVISNNTFGISSLYPGYIFYSIGFRSVNGTGWCNSPVGGATITGNNFDDLGTRGYVYFDGTVPADGLDFNAILSNNTFAKGAAMAFDPSGAPRPLLPSDPLYNAVTKPNQVMLKNVITNEIAKASDGDVIKVVSGTYNESLDISKSLTIQGAGQATTFIDQSANAAAGNVVSIHGACGSVKVDGFTIKTGIASSVACNGVSISGLTAPGTITISNNTIWGNQLAIKDNLCLIAGYFSITTPKLVFDHNLVHGGVSSTGVSNPILIERWMGPLEITNNTIDHDSYDLGPSDVIVFLNYDYGNITEKQLISGNNIDMGWGTTNQRGAGITFWSGYNGGTLSGGYTNIEVSNNTLLNLKPNRRGISLYNSSGGDGSGGNIADAVISGNTVSNATSNSGEFGIRVRGKATGTQITNNHISGVNDAVLIAPQSGHEPSGIAVHNNSFLGVVKGCNNLSSVLVNAEYNDWGSVHGPYDPIGTVEMPGSPSTSVADMKNTIPAGKLGSAVSENVAYYKWQGKSNPNAQGGGIAMGGYVNPTSNDIFAGFDPAASDGIDSRDTVAPPPPPSDYLFLYFLSDPGQPLDKYSCDIKKEESSTADKAKQWDLRAVTDHYNELVTIEFPVTGLPSGFKPTLYETATGKYQNLRDYPFYTYTSPATETPSSFLILIGDSTKPAITVTSPNGGEYLVKNSAYNIAWTSSDASGVLRHYIYYSLTGSAPYTFIDSTNGNVHTYSWTPTTASGTAVIKVVAKDSVMNEEGDISNQTFVILESNSITYNASFGWNLLSVPMQQITMTPAAVFGDDYGVTPYYTYQYSPSGGYTVPTALNMGQGYWLGSNSAQIIDAEGTPLSSLDLDLATGFNIIGNPFATSLMKADLRFTDGTDVKNIADAQAASWLLNTLYGYNGTSYYVEGTSLGVWKGYWIPTLVSGITVQYSPTVSVPTPKTSNPVISPTNWDVNVIAEYSTANGVFGDKISSFGVRADAKEGFDNMYDAPRPPRSPSPDYVEVIFPVTGESFPTVLGTNYSKNYKPADKAVWDVVVKTSGEGVVKLTWDNSEIKTLPQEVNVVLYDGFNKKTIDLKQNDSYTYYQSGTSHQFTINKNSTGVEPGDNRPLTFGLEQNYPNPFNPSTVITYSLPSASIITLDVFNSLGQKVASLVDGKQEAGYHHLRFNAAGLSSGIYVYRLTAIAETGEVLSISQKMLLMK